MKNSLSLVLFLMLALQLLSSPVQARGVDYRKVVQGGAVYDAVFIDLKDRNISLTLQVPGGFPLKNDSFTDFVAFAHPDAAITGTYFNMTTCAPVGDMAMFGKPIHYGEVGTTMAITPGREVFFSRTVGKFIARWENYETILAAGPRLLKEGKVDVHPELEGFTDKRIFGLARRCALGYAPAENRLIMATSRGSVSLDDLARLFLSLGCTEAMNLDGGSSSALYYKGSYYATPLRKLTNLLIVFDSPARYQAYRKGCAYTFFRTGTTFMGKGKYFQAMLNFRGATAADPDNAGYYNALTDAYWQLGWPLWTSWSLAKEGEIYEKKGNQKEALLHYERALNTSRNNPEALRWMIAYYEKNGDKDYADHLRNDLCQYQYVHAALKQDLYSVKEEKPIFPEMSWDSSRDGAFQEKAFGLSLKLMPSWELAWSTPFYALFRNRNNPKLMICLEAVKAENFVDLEKTALDVMKKRGASPGELEKIEASGVPMLKEKEWATTINGEPWMTSTLFTKRQNRVFVMTAGAPASDSQALHEAFDAAVKGFSFQPR